MAYEQRDLTGSLFKNDKRETDSHPNAKGSALIDGVSYWMDAWTNEAKDGSKYQSLKFKRKDVQSAQGSQGAPIQRAPYDDDQDDSVPFVTCDFAYEHQVR